VNDKRVDEATRERKRFSSGSCHRVFGERGLTGSDYVYVRADGIDLRIRLAEAKSCVLVVVGVRADGTKELLLQGPRGGVPRNPHQRCWVHKTADVLNALSASAQAVAALERRTARSGPRPPGRSPTTLTNCRRSTTSRPSTGFTCARRIRRTPRDPRGMTDLNHPHGIDNYLREGPCLPECGVGSLTCSYRSAMTSR
jgi:hypothetical protein